MASVVSLEMQREIEQAMDPFDGFCPMTQAGRHCHRKARVSVIVVCLSCGTRKAARVCLRHWLMIRRHKISHHEPGTDPRGCAAGGPWHALRRRDG